MIIAWCVITTLVNASRILDFYLNFWNSTWVSSFSCINLLFYSSLPLLLHHEHLNHQLHQWFSTVAIPLTSRICWIWNLIFQSSSSIELQQFYKRFIEPHYDEMPDLHEGLENVCLMQKYGFGTFDFVGKIFFKRKPFKVFSFPLKIQPVFITHTIWKYSPYKRLINNK